MRMNSLEIQGTLSREHNFSLKIKQAKKMSHTNLIKTDLNPGACDG